MIRVNQLVTVGRILAEDLVQLLNDLIQIRLLLLLNFATAHRRDRRELRVLPLAEIHRLFAAIFLLLAKRGLRFTFSKPQVIGAICYAGCTVAFCSSTKLTTAANAILLQHTAPVWIALFSAWILGERTTRIDWITVAIVLGGMALFLRDGLVVGNVLGNEIRGKAGKDRLYGDLGADFITGGKDTDRIIYYSADESTASQADTVKFGKKDRFQFRSFDGDSLTEGQQSLRYIGKKAFSGAASELRFTGSGLQADTTGDGQADFVVNFAKATPWFSEANILL